MREHYLDGLRGWAAVFVMLGHVGPMFLTAGASTYYFPFFTDGELAFYIFFVLSGYVLSRDFFVSGSRKIAIEMAIRRYPRLTIPISMSVLATLTFLEFGLLSNQSAAKLSSNQWLADFYQFPASLSEAISFALASVYLTPAGTASYNPTLWTMHYEMVASLCIFLVFFISGSNKTTQTVLTLVACISALYASSLFGAFAIGVLLALVRSKWRIKESDSLAIYILIFTLCFSFIRFFGNYGHEVAVYGALIVWCVLASPTIQRFLNNPVSQFLGKISFPLYITHLLVICSLTSYFYTILSTDGELGLAQRTALIGITIAASFGTALLFLPIEQFAIKFSRSFSKKVMRFLTSKSHDPRTKTSGIQDT